MSETVRTLSPGPLWGHFSDLNAIPRASKNESQVIDFIRAFGESLGLTTSVDKAGNVFIRKPATSGREDRPVVLLQSHLDMVHQKNSDTTFDFATEGIRMMLDGDWVKADGTTLGADNGIGVAAIMAILASKDLPHPPLEAIFTIDEETGMTGALELEPGRFMAKYMLNLDTEDDRELTIGCAGGVDVTAVGTYPESHTPDDMLAFRITIRGLTGGHSGMDIHLGRGNANKMMNRILYDGVHRCGLRIAAIEGGGLRNAIPRESIADVIIPSSQESTLRTAVAQLSKILRDEYATTDPELMIGLSSIPLPVKVMSEEFQLDFVRAVYACPNGIYRMSPDIPDLVQTSNNLARIQCSNGKLMIMCLTRSAVDSEKTDLAHAIRSTFELIGADVALEGSYPGWAPRPDATIVRLMSDLYREMFHEEPLVNACHAGLECGIIGRHYPHMEMISFGPNIRGAHSPDEKVQVSSVQKFWKYLTTTLERM